MRSVERIHTRLRSLIMNGHYPPGEVLPQVQLARMLGVSRTPLREAMRRLEEEGLIESRQNHRARVATIGAEALDVLYTDRLLLEAMGVKVTVPRLTEVDLNGLFVATTSFRVALERHDAEAQVRARRTLHRTFVTHAGERLRSTIAAQFESCERYRRLFTALPTDAAEAYIAIAAACAARDPDDAARRIARLEERLARSTLHGLDSSYAPVAIATALQMIEGTPRKAGA